MSRGRAGTKKRGIELARARRFARTGAFLAAFLAPAVARGDGASLAEALFRQARDAIHHGDYATACPLLAESQRLDPSTGTLLNLGTCEEHEGHLATAWAAFRSLLDTTPEGDERAVFARARVAALEPRLAWLRLRVQGDPSAPLTVSLDATPLGAASFGVQLAVNPGTHVVVLDAPPREKRTITVVLQEGQHEDAVLEVPALPSSSTRSSSVADRPASAARRSVPWPTVGIVTASVGGAGIVAGGILAGLAASKNADSNASGVPGGPCVGNVCPPTALAERQSARSLGSAATAAFIFGTSLVAAGTVVWVVGRHRQPASSPHIGFAVSGMGVFARGEF